MELRLLSWRDGEIGHPGQHPLEADLEFESRQVRSEATVHTCAEAEVSVVPAVQDAPVRVGNSCSSRLAAA